MKSSHYKISTGEYMFTVESDDENIAGAAPVDGVVAFSDVGSPEVHYYDAASGALIAMPPPPSARHVFDYRDKKWIDPRTLADLQAGLKAEVAAMRWGIESGGITLNGVRVATAIDDQNRITSVIANAAAAGVTVLDFKAASGWVSLSLDDLRGIANTIALHVQACFSAERAHCEAIDALSAITDPTERRAALESYDVTQGWPGTTEPQP